ncbi:MAG: glycosyltransferase family 4 protein, partial [Gammaproteobacteria bacterium]|nr:glycosyltransferase family 4 protein [Gammaproteobacteria bacterium]
MSKKVLIKGWRGINHSFAMVNQHQIVALLNHHPEVALYHRDVKFFMDHWSPVGNDAGFSVEDKTKIDALTDIDESEVDAVYQIYNPLTEPETENKTISFLVTEMELNPSKFTSREFVNKPAFTREDNWLVTPTKWAKDRVAEYGFDEAKIKVLPHGVNTDYFYPFSDEVRKLTRSKLDISEDEIVFLNIGVPTWNKGVDIALEAFAKINKRFPNTRFIIKDSSDLYGLSIHKTINNLINNKPELVSPQFLNSILSIPLNMTQSAMRSLYNVADAYLSPYRAEGFNLPVLEAMACGTPLIISSYGATDDFCPTNLAGVYKIPTIFNRGDIGDRKNLCWVEADMDSLVKIMSEVVLSGGKQNSGYSGHQKALVNNAK